MPWFRVDDNLAFHHKVVAAGNPAIGLWARAGSLCAQQLTDGFVPDHMVSALGTVAQAKRLVESGLWRRVEGGYRFHDWGERQPSKASVEAERAAAQDRMRAYRAKKKGVAHEASSQVSEPRAGDVQANERRTNGEVRDVFADPSPTQPIPALPNPPSAGEVVEIVEGEIVPDALSAQGLVGEWIDHCTARPPKSVIGQVAKHVKAMLDEGIDPERLRFGLAEWNRKGVHPSVLPSVVHEVANKQPRGTSRNEEWRSMQERQMARAIQREQEMGLR
jgi:hypothetical protein